MSNFPFVIGTLGFAAVDCACGVYHLEQTIEGALTFDGVGLLYCVEPRESASLVQLFVANRLTTPERIRPTIKQLMECWALLDARRMAEAGLEPIELPHDIGVFGPVTGRHQAVRPDGRVRFLAEMASGDILCQN